MKSLSCVGLLLALSLPTPAFADQITIQSGHLDFSWGPPPRGGPVVLSGERGFSVQATNPNLRFAATTCRPDLSFDLPCVGGTPLGLTIALAPIGTATLDGVVYSDVNREPEPTTLLEMNIFARATLPPVDSTATIEGAFFLDGPLNRFRYVDPDGALQTAPLIGSGTATFSLRRHESLNEWVLDGASFDFQPVPEPSTLLLVAGGAATMLARQGRKARRNS